MKFEESEIVKLEDEYNDSIVKEVVAFLNSLNGTIYIGVKKDGTVVGVDNLEESFIRITKAINGILPNCKEYIQLGTKYVDGMHIIEIDVTKGKSLYYLKEYGRSTSGCFMRIGSNYRRMTEEEIERLQIKYLLAQSKLVDVISLEQNLEFNNLKDLYKSKKLTIDDNNFETNLRLLNSDKYNLQAQLLSNKNNVSIEVIKYKGEEKTKDVELRIDFGQRCLINAMQDVYNYCMNEIYCDGIINYNNHQIEIELFDKDFREAWFNACLHNDWLDGTPPVVYVYDNRIEIVSTGGLPYNFSKNDFFKGISKPVNESLSKIFIQLGLTQQTGYGVPLIVNKYGKNAFEFLDHFLKVTIPFGFKLSEKNKVIIPNDTNLIPNKHQMTPNDTKKETKKPRKNMIETKKPEKKKEIVLDKKEIEIYKLLLEDVRLTVPDLVKKSGKSRSSVLRALMGLKNKDIIERKGTNQNGTWNILIVLEKYKNTDKKVD